MPLIGAAYYLRIVATTFFGERDESTQPIAKGPRADWATPAVVLCAVIVVALGCVPGYFIGRFSEVEPLVEQVQQGAASRQNAATVDSTCGEVGHIRGVMFIRPGWST